MALIKLTKGFETLIDDNDYERLNVFKWHASGVYHRPARRLRDNTRRMVLIYHQILDVWPWELEGKEIDHINRNPLDNRKENLRLVSHADNMRNSKRSIDRKGICFDRTQSKWKAYLDQPRINIGTFETENEAREALANMKKVMGYS
jgi:hypothetical protein